MARSEEVSNRRQAEALAYSERPVAIEPGLSTDIAPIGYMMAKLVTQEILRGKPTTLRSLDEDLVASWFIWLNRREVGTEYEKMEPMGFNLDGFHILRWYGIKAERHPGCPECGDFRSHLLKESAT